MAGLRLGPAVAARKCGPPSQSIQTCLTIAGRARQVPDGVQRRKVVCIRTSSGSRQIRSIMGGHQDTRVSLYTGRSSSVAAARKREERRHDSSEPGRHDHTMGPYVVQAGRGTTMQPRPCRRVVARPDPQCRIARHNSFGRPSTHPSRGLHAGEMASGSTSCGRSRAGV